MKHLVSLICILFILNSLKAQVGAPLLTNFNESREIENQSWAICQDENSVMLFANRRGIMTFDGQTWSFIRMPAIPYSLKYNPGNRRVYVGCDNNYGFLEKDDKGFYLYNSLTSDSAYVGLITKLIFTDSTVCFYSETTISRHNIKTGLLEKRIRSKESESFTGMFITPGNTFINVMSKGLCRLEADTLFPIVTGYMLENKEVLFSLPYNKNLVLLGLSDGSLSLFDGIKFYDYQIKDEGYLRQNVLSEGISVSDSLYAFASLNGGAVVVGKSSGKLFYTINYENGLPDDEVFALGSDNKGGLWLSHPAGLSRADLLLPLCNFSIYPGLKGNLITSVWHNNELFVATSDGVFYLTEIKNYKTYEVLVKNEQISPIRNSPSMVLTPSVQNHTENIEAPVVKKTKQTLLSRIFGKKPAEKPSVQTSSPVINQSEQSLPTVRQDNIAKYVKKTFSKLKSVNYEFKKIEGLDDKCKQLAPTPFGILASTNNGLYNISGHSAKVVVKGSYVNFISNPSSDNKYYIATSEGFFYVTSTGGTLSYVFPDKGFNQPLYSISSVSKDELWAGGNSTAYKITINESPFKVSYNTYSQKNDFPMKYMVGSVNDTLFLITESGISYYDRQSDSFRKYRMAEITEGSKLNYIISQPDIPWFKHGDEWRSLSGLYRITENDKALLKIFDDLLSISLNSDFIWAVTGDNKLFRIDRNKLQSMKSNPDLFVKSISNDDGLYFELSDIVFGRGNNTVYFNIIAPDYLKERSTQYQYILEEMMTEWSKWSYNSTITLMTTPGKYTLKVRAKDLWGNISETKVLRFTIEAPFTQTTFFYILLAVFALFIVIVIIRIRESQLQKTNRLLERKVKERTAEIEAQKEDITASIAYASRIQRAMLPEEGNFRDIFPDSFIIFKPRDIVSGDFYWIGEDDKHFFMTVADCTGHGVPGAFMSTLGISVLNEIITHNQDLQANTVLNLLREKIKTSLHQTGKEGEAADGMDMSLCVFKKNRKSLQYSGAYNSLFIVTGGEFKEYKADRMPIGIHYGDEASFTNYEINVRKGDAIYIFTDGFSDQFGGPDCSKYKKANLKKLLSEIHFRSMADQKSIIESEFDKWRGKTEQVDDITIIGVRI